MAVPPAVKFPQFMEPIGVVHALLEYKPQFADVVTAPLEDTCGDVETPIVEDAGDDVETASIEDTCGDVVMAAKVVSDKASPIMTNATTVVFIESFRFDATTGVVFGIGSFRTNPVAAVVFGIGSFRTNPTVAAVDNGIGSFRTNPTVAAVVNGIGSFRTNPTVAVFIGSLGFDATVAVVFESFRFAIIILLRQWVCCKSNLCSKS